MHYRRFLLRERIAAIDNKTDYKVNLYKALRFLHRSWSDVKPETIANCFRKAGFIKNIEVGPGELLGEGDDEAMMREVEGDDELNNLWAELQGMELAEGTLDEYLAVDDQLAIGGTLTLAEIAADVSTADVVELAER